MLEMVKPNSMPPLPAGFKEKHSKETAKSDDPKAFLTKAEYLDLYKKQRAATMKVLDGMSDADLDKPAPEPMRLFEDGGGDIHDARNALDDARRTVGHRAAESGTAAAVLESSERSSFATGLWLRS